MVRKAVKESQEARQSWEKWRGYWQSNIDQYHEMTRFVLGEQWNEEEAEILKTYKKVPLQFPKLGTMVNAMLGEQQQNTPQLQVAPMENCDYQVARIRELLVKNILFSTESKTVFQVCASQAFIGGFSAVAVLTRYTHNKSFDQDLYFKYYKDPTKCYWDIGSEDINKTDGLVCGWVSRVSREKVRQDYGDAVLKKIAVSVSAIAATQEEVAMVSDPGVEGEQYIWADDQTITIQHHFKKVCEKNMLYKLSNGRNVNQEELDEIIEHSIKINEEQMMSEYQSQLAQHQALTAQMMQAQSNPQMMQDPNMSAGQYDPLLGQQAPTQMEMPPPPVMGKIDESMMPLYDGDELVRIEDEKEANEYYFKYTQFCGDYALEDTIMKTDMCPLVFVDQNSYYDKNGKQICRPFVIDAKDAQKYINYLGTQSAYVLKVSRYDQWIGSRENVKSLHTQGIWTDPLTIQGMLVYDESPSGAKPERIQAPELSQSLLTQYERAINDLYTSTGLYPTRMGMQGNEISGDAIDARTRQGSFATYVAFNSINRAIHKCGEIVNQLIPHVYDSTRVIALMTPDEGMQNFVINKQMDDYGEQIENDIRKGTFQVRLLPGPSYEGQKEQALESLNAVITAAPQTFPLMADLYADNLPLANTIELRNRLKTLVPPQIIEAGKTGKSPPQQPQQPNPEMMQFQLQAQAQQQMAILKQKELQIKQAELQLKAEKQNADIQMQLRQLQAEELKVQGEIAKARMQYESDMTRNVNDYELGHANNMANILTHMGSPKPAKPTQ